MTGAIGTHPVIREPGYNDHVIKTLFNCGAWFLRLRDRGKRPLSQLARIPGAPWRAKRLPLAECLDLASRGLYLGLVPGSLGLAAIDVDHGSGRQLAAEIGSPYWHPSATKGRTHIWTMHPKPGTAVSNCKWEWKGCSGDMRIDNGYTVAYDLNVVLAAFRDENLVTLPRLFWPEDLRTQGELL